MDLRPPLAPAMGAFGVPATITVPWGSPITTAVMWVEDLTAEDSPFGHDRSRVEPHKLMVISRDDLDRIVPRKTIVNAPETLGGVSREWQVDSIVARNEDEHRVVVVPKTDVG